MTHCQIWRSPVQQGFSRSFLPPPLPRPLRRGAEGGSVGSTSSRVGPEGQGLVQENVAKVLKHFVHCVVSLTSIRIF